MYEGDSREEHVLRKPPGRIADFDKDHLANERKGENREAGNSVADPKYRRGYVKQRCGEDDIGREISVCYNEGQEHEQHCSVSFAADASE